MSIPPIRRMPAPAIRRVCTLAVTLGVAAAALAVAFAGPHPVSVASTTLDVVAEPSFASTRAAVRGVPGVSALPGGDLGLEPGPAARAAIVARTAAGTGASPGAVARTTVTDSIDSPTFVVGLPRRLVVQARQPTGDLASRVAFTYATEFVAWRSQAVSQRLAGILRGLDLQAGRAEPSELPALLRQEQQVRVAQATEATRLGPPQPGTVRLASVSRGRAVVVAAVTGLLLGVLLEVAIRGRWLRRPSARLRAGSPGDVPL